MLAEKVSVKLKLIFQTLIPFPTLHTMRKPHLEVQLISGTNLG